MVSALNPKTTVFFLAVVPQFITVNQPLVSQYMVIGLTLAFTDMVVMASYTAMASKVLLALKKPAHVQILNRVLGAFCSNASYPNGCGQVRLTGAWPTNENRFTTGSNDLSFEFVSVATAPTPSHRHLNFCS